MGTQEEIQQRINERLTIDANLLEGGFSQDIIGSVSYELANIYDTEINTILDKAFVTTSSGEFLDLVGKDYGIDRRLDTNAVVYLEITGTQGAVINQNIKATFNNLVFTVKEYKKINSDGIAKVKAECETTGVIGNVAANSITEFITPYQGLISVNNPDASYDGFDREDDETYRQRILDYLKEDATNANKQQYEQWARSVPGVQKAVIKSAEVMGAGNVGVFVSAINQTVSDELIANVKTHIESVQPINATVLVQSLNYVNIDINATLSLKDGYTTTDVKDEFIVYLNEYLPTVENIVSYFRVSELLFQCTGVEDVVEYTLNGNKTSVEIGDTDYATVGEVVINEY